MNNRVVGTLSRFLPDPAIRSVLRVWPQKSFRDVMQISDIMTQRSQKIIDEKKAALAKGDAGLAHEIGEGKDIMSICRASFLSV